MAVWRITRAVAESGRGRSTWYSHVATGLMVRPFSLGKNSSGVLSEEVEAINRAWAAGKNEDEIKQLVRSLHAARAEVIA